MPSAKERQSFLQGQTKNDLGLIPSEKQDGKQNGGQYGGNDKQNGHQDGRRDGQQDNDKQNSRQTDKEDSNQYGRHDRQEIRPTEVTTNAPIPTEGSTIVTQRNITIGGATGFEYDEEDEYFMKIVFSPLEYSAHVNTVKLQTLPLEGSTRLGGNRPLMGNSHIEQRHQDVSTTQVKLITLNLYLFFLFFFCKSQLYNCAFSEHNSNNQRSNIYHTTETIFNNNNN